MIKSLSAELGRVKSRHPGGGCSLSKVGEAQSKQYACGQKYWGNKLYCGALCKCQGSGAKLIIIISILKMGGEIYRNIFMYGTQKYNHVIIIYLSSLW